MLCVFHDLWNNSELTGSSCTRQIWSENAIGRDDALRNQHGSLGLDVLRSDSPSLLTSAILPSDERGRCVLRN